MAGTKTQFEEYLSKEVSASKGIYIPVKSSLLRRLTVHNAPPKTLHPNPDDEFCDPAIGPNYQIVSNYEQQISERKYYGMKPLIKERLIVEKTHPKGYRLLNGHHRWAAAVRMGAPSVPIKIVNLTQKQDIQRMIAESRHEKRVTMDLDEVVFCTNEAEPAEQPPSFPFNRMFKERLRLGVIALFRYLNVHGYDIWVYSANYYSMDYIQRLFKAYHVTVAGIITGTARKTSSADREQTEALIRQKYPVTLHIDRNSVVRVDKDTKDYQDYPLSGSPDTWSQEVMDVVGGERPIGRSGQ